MTSEPNPRGTLAEELDEEIALAVAGTWPAVLFTGLLTIGLGIVVMVWPGETLQVLSILLGLQLLAFGVYRLINAFSARTSSPWLAGFVGILGMVTGIIVLRNPFETVAVLVTLLGVVWIVGGSIDVIAAITDRRLRDRGWMAFLGFISIAAGIVVVAWPEPTVTVVAWISGLYLVTFGLVFCIGAFRLKSLES